MAPPTDDGRPNVLWITTDQHRYDALGCYGNGVVETPNIDALAATGVRFERCFCQNPICTPSRASMLTGRYPRTARCRQNGQPIPADERLLPRRLAEAGYDCGLAGKLHVSPTNLYDDADPALREPVRRIGDGYGSFDWSPRPDMFPPANEYQRWLRERDREFERSAVDGSDHVSVSMAPEYHHTTWCVGRAVDFVENAAESESPWLYSVNLFDPHSPFDPPEEYLDRYRDRLDDVAAPNYEPGELDDKPPFQRRQHDGETSLDYDAMDEAEHRLVRAAYYAMVDLIDDRVGDLLDALERTGQRENTVVVFTADHGELLGDHGMYLKGPFFYEPAVRVPLVISAPGRIEGGRTSGALVELTDLAPTLADLCGLDRAPGTQGRSLAPLLTGDAALDDHREDVYCEFYDSQPNFSDPPAEATMLRTDRHKLVRFHGVGGGELYDLEADPTETTNRWDDPAYADVRAALHGRLADRMAGTVDPLPERVGRW